MEGIRTMTTSDTRPTTGGTRLLSRKDWAIIGCGALVLLASFLPWEAASSGGLGAVYTGSASAWNAGFAAWFGSLLCAAAAAAVAARHQGHLAGIRGIGPNLTVCGLAGVGAVLLVIRLLTLPRSGSYGLLGPSAGSYGPSFGAFAGTGLAVVQAIIAALSLRASGERLPSLAAPGPPPVPSRPAGPPPPAPQYNQELARRLSHLDHLRAQGTISDGEHAEQRRRIISEI
jgi:hypothetical protein